jgi:uncharacterized protein (DUF1800 family)
VIRSVAEGAGSKDPGGDPGEALLAYRPGVDGPWDRPTAAHLARRAGFGMPAPLLQTILSAGPEAAARDLLEPKPEVEDVEFTNRTASRLESVDGAQNAWVHRMLVGANAPLEKLALFWHGHFATSVRKVEKAKLMMRQIDLFREKGTGPFGDLLEGVARDPAMITWLDGNLNRRGKPNENFARELFELFALGIGHYTERDIKEAARAFTGWHARDGHFWFNERAHDTDVKTVFGHSGPFGGEDVLRLSVEHEACAGFIAGKLFEFYVRPGPSPELRRALAKAYRDSGFRTGEFLARLFSSRAFYSAESRRAIVATPADFAVGGLRTLGARASAKAVARSLAEMGQELLAPPSVKGWDMGQAWLSSTTLLARYGFAMGIAGWSGSGAVDDLNPRLDWGRLSEGGGRAVIDLLFPEGLPVDVVAELVSGAKGDPQAVAMGCLELPEGQFV